MKNKVLIAVNTYAGHAYCREEFIINLKKLGNNPRYDTVIFYNGERNPWGFEDFKIIYYDPEPGMRGIDVLLAKHKMMRTYFLKRIDYGWMFMLESDNIPPVNAIDKFLAYDKDIISAVYFIKTNDREFFKLPYNLNFKRYDPKRGVFEDKRIKEGESLAVMLQKIIPSVWGLNKGRSALWEFNDFLPQRGLVRVLSSGIGSVLIKRDVLRNVEFRLRDITAKIQQFTDFLFYYDAQLKGYEAFVDTDTIAEHYHIDWGTQNFRKWFKLDNLEGVPVTEEIQRQDQKVFV